MDRDRKDSSDRPLADAADRPLADVVEFFSHQVVVVPWATENLAHYLEGKGITGVDKIEHFLLSYQAQPVEFLDTLAAFGFPCYPIEKD